MVEVKASGNEFETRAYKGSTIIGCQEIDEKFIKEKFSAKKSKFKAFETYLQGKIQISRNIKNKEFEVLLSEILDAYKKMFKTKDIIIERIGFIRDGHTYNIYKGFDNDFRVFIYESDTPMIIDKEKINFLRQLILNCEVGVHYSARYFFEKIIKHYKLDVSSDAFSGGRNRCLYYFPLYLAPIKIIEKEIGNIKVNIGKGGGLTRLK